METTKQEKRIKVLTAYALFSSVLLLGIIAYLILRDENTHSSQKILTEEDSLRIKFLSVERLDIVEPDGKLAISLSNSTTSPNPTFDDVEIEGVSNRDIPNIIFFDGEGDEVGGMAFSNNLDSDWQQGIRHLAFDGFNQDEVITFSHFIKNDSVSRTGLYISERPSIHIFDAFNEIGLLPNDNEATLRKKVNQFKKDNPQRFEEIWQLKPRISVHKDEKGDAEINLQDGERKVRIKIFVKDNGESGIHFFDENGKVTKEFQ